MQRVLSSKRNQQFGEIWVPAKQAKNNTIKLMFKIGMNNRANGQSWLRKILHSDWDLSDGGDVGEKPKLPSANLVIKYKHKYKYKYKYKYKHKYKYKYNMMMRIKHCWTAALVSSGWTGGGP